MGHGCPSSSGASAMVDMVKLMEKGHKFLSRYVGQSSLSVEINIFYVGKIQSKGWRVVIGTPSTLGPFPIILFGFIGFPMISTIFEISKDC